MPRYAEETERFTHFCLVASGTMTYSSKGSKMTTFSLACGVGEREEVCAHLAMKTITKG